LTGVTFWLTGCTTLGRSCFAETSELMGGVALPVAFRQILAQHLGT
jgi:hypothetical protein